MHNEKITDDPLVPPHMGHMAPVKHLVREVLHVGTTLEQRVKRLRYKRRKPKVADAPVEAQP